MVFYISMQVFSLQILFLIFQRADQLIVLFPVNIFFKIARKNFERPSFLFLLASEEDFFPFHQDIDVLALIAPLPRKVCQNFPNDIRIMLFWSFFGVLNICKKYMTEKKLLIDCVWS